MKFLLLFSVLLSSVAFAQKEKEFVACYEAARQGGHGELAYLFEVKGQGDLHIVFPDIKGGPLKPDDGCLEQPGEGSITDPKERLKLCKGEGQRINGLVPIEASYGRFEETVYCDKKIKQYFWGHHPEM